MIFPDTQLYDYFAVIGYNPEFGLKQEKSSEFGDKATLPLPKSPLETSYEAKIIAHYPKERDGKPFAPEICSLAMPCGVRLYTEQNIPRDPSFHSFVVVREDGTRLHGCSLVFYEELKSLELRQQIFDAQLTYLRAFASNSTSIPQSFISGTNESALPNASSRKFTTHSLPRKLSSTRRNSSNPNNSNANDEHLAYYKNAKTPLFVSKSMVLLSPIPVIYSSENLLHNIWMVINDKFTEEPIVFEDLLYWTLHQIPLPPPGNSMNVSHCHFQLLVKRPNPNEFDFFDYPIVNLFNHFSSLDIFFKVLTSFMLEKQILIISKNARTLMLVAETLSTLIYPFVWNLAYCPILPHSQMKFLEAPVPWLMGLCLENESDSFKEELPQSNICLLDIDSQRLEAPEDLPSFPRLQKISAQISALQKEFAERPAPEGIHGFYQRGLQFNQEIRSIFVNHFATIFSSYENYLLNTGTEIHLDKSIIGRNRRRNAKILRESTANFDKISFLVDQPESILTFLSAFLETQMFTSFIDSKILSSQQNPTMGQSENAAICIFDQRIANLQKLNAQNDDQISFVEENLANNPPEYRINPPAISTMDFTPKYGGFLPNIDYSYLLNKLPNKSENSTTILERTEELLEEKTHQQNQPPKQQLIMGGKENLLLNKTSNEPQQSNNDKKLSQPPMLAHQNWKFVEQLLNETKAKTKRILVAKMGKEAIHLGHGQLSNFGVSGVEENTLVAAFCDLLERIWSHGLKRKQGKSALWAYITAYHEFEEKNNRISSRRSSSIDVDNPPANGESSVKNDNNITDESPMLVELISSIRRIAGTMEMPARSRDNSPHHFHSSTTNLTNNWSQSLLRAANVICDKIATTNLTGEDQQMKELKQIDHQNLGQNLSNKAANLPPRPPPSSASSKGAMENEWKLFTPQIRRKIKKEEEEDKTVEAYRKFIYNGPLKAVNNNQPAEENVERKSRESSRPKRSLPRSASSQPSNGFEEHNKNLASHVSEDSLSRMASSTYADKPPPSTPKRSARDLSIGPHHQGLPPVASNRHHHQQRNRSLSRSNSPSRLYERLTRGVLGGTEPRTLNPLPNTMAYDLKNIIRMTEIKTDIGFARAFVRLALERKSLYLYLKKLLSNTQLLQKMYKRYSFLRSDDEREQFLFHLLSLNAVDFSCFTNTFLTIKMRYQVLLVGSLDKFSESLVYIVLTGSLGCTSHIFLPANSTQFTFHFKNLGLLSTLRVGHSTKDRTNQKLTKWYLDYVLVRNCVTAQTFYFRCGRWFGRGIDDGALERLLVAEAIVSRPVDETQSDCEQPSPMDQRRPESPSSVAAIFLSPRKTNKFDVANSTYSSGAHQNQQRMMRRLRSPSSDRRKMSSDYELPMAGGQSMEGIAALDQLQTLEHRAGMAVNALMKHFLANTERDQQNAIAKLSTLLCAEDGLVPCIDEIFSKGLVHRIFQRTYPWDYVEKVFVWFNQFFRNGDSRKLTREQRSLIIYAYKMVERIGAHNVVGKEGKFHLFVLLSIRDHIFSGLIPLMAWTPVTSQIYEPNAFLRQSSKLSYLAKLLGSLNEFQFTYEKSLTHGIAF